MILKAFTHISHFPLMWKTVMRNLLGPHYTIGPTFIPWLVLILVPRMPLYISLWYLRSVLNETNNNSSIVWWVSLDKSSHSTAMNFPHSFVRKSHYDNAPVNYPSVDTTSEIFTHFSQYTCETSGKCGKAVSHTRISSHEQKHTTHTHTHTHTQSLAFRSKSHCTGNTAQPVNSS